mmetsp:Transcript_10148/g.26333  ORF Transcript_10148/g.26333 Transcript_10148/m.26333 type:complete len:295 (+) Transcript_10148:125-1009(+)
MASSDRQCHSDTQRLRDNGRSMHDARLGHCQLTRLKNSEGEERVQSREVERGGSLCVWSGQRDARCTRSSERLSKREVRRPRRSHRVHANCARGNCCRRLGRERRLLSDGAPALEGEGADKHGRDATVDAHVDGRHVHLVEEGAPIFRVVHDVQVDLIASPRVCKPPLEVGDREPVSGRALQHLQRLPERLCVREAAHLRPRVVHCDDVERLLSGRDDEWAHVRLKRVEQLGPVLHVGGGTGGAIGLLEVEDVPPRTVGVACKRERAPGGGQERGGVHRLVERGGKDCRLQRVD